MSKSDHIIQELNTFVQTYAASSEFIQTTTIQKINATQAHMLMLLKSTKATNTFLSEKMHLTKPAVTKAIKNLIAHGYVTATKDALDKRSINYILTPKGIHLAEQHEISHQDLHHSIDHTIASFTLDQQDTIINFLNKINHLEDNDS